MRVIVYEFICGGGYAEQPLPAGVLAEGYAMLRCALEDFKQAGHEVTVLLDYRLSKLNPPLEADYIVPVMYTDEASRFLLAAASINDAVYIVAPETNGTLQNLVKHAEETHRVILNSKSEAIAEVADKASLYAALKRNGIPSPKALILNVSNPTEAVQAVSYKLGFPVVFKPIDGAGCSGISLIENEMQTAEAILTLKSKSQSSRFIAQQYVDGEPVSVSLIANGKKAVALTLNKQQVNLSNAADDSSYRGGVVPFKHPLQSQAVALAQKAVEAFEGLRGYVGVDLVLSDEDVFIVDVNARLTTSYVGLHHVAKFNVADAIVDASVDGKLPEKPQMAGFACFQKIQIPTTTQATYLKALELEAVVSPPFPLEGSKSSNALIIGCGASLAEAQAHLGRANKNLLDIMC